MPDSYPAVTTGITLPVKKPAPQSPLFSFLDTLPVGFQEHRDHGQQGLYLLAVRPGGQIVQHTLRGGELGVLDRLGNRTAEYLSLIHISEPTRPY